MVDLTAEQEEQLIEDLLALVWTRNLYSESVQVISNRLGCSTQDAEMLRKQLQSTHRIELVYESGETPEAAGPPDSWKWGRGTK